MGESTFLGFLHDRGERWIQWIPGMSATDEIREAARNFEPVDNSAGQAAASWLAEQASVNHPSTVTHLMVVNGRIEAFFALCSAQVKLSQRERRRALEGEREHRLLPVQPAALIAWLARDRRSEVSGVDILAQAAAAALEVIDVGQGQIALALQAFDEDTAEFWRDRYGFRPSQALNGHGALWKTLMGPPDRD